MNRPAVARTPQAARTLLMARGAVLLATLAFVAACSPSGNIDVAGRSPQRPDPATIDFPLAYVKRTIPPLDADIRDLNVFATDADVFVRDRADNSVPERNITQRVTGNQNWDIRGLDVSFDGRKLVFAMRGPITNPNADIEDQPTWNLWEYEFSTDTLRRLITSDIIANEGQDISPHYLPDGRIVFSSTRQRAAKAVLLDEGKPQFDPQTEDNRESAFVLHVMNANGSNIRQISFSQSHDLDPTVLTSGRILFSRWDTSPGRSAIHLYTMNPDGSDLQLHYGAVSHFTGTNNSEIQFVQAREMQNGRILALVKPYEGTDLGGDLVVIDAQNYVENTQGVLANASGRGPAQTPATGNEVRTVPGISPGGRFNSAFPLWDGTGRILVSWTQCRALIGTDVRPCTSDVLANPAVQPAPPLYSLWMYDPNQRGFLPIGTPEADRMITDAVIAQPRPLPAVILDPVPGVNVDRQFVDENVGILDIRSVYDFSGVDTAQPNIATLANPMLRTADQRPARFIRLEKRVALPDDDILDLDGAAFGASPFMREILGYAPVEPDGSVRMKVPANVAFQISVLDRDGRRISPVHRSWLQIRPGEVLSCNGCHVRNPQAPTSHGRKQTFASVWPGATSGAFPGANTSLAPNVGETMSQTRARLSCQLTGFDRCRSMQTSVDVAFEDVWTTQAASGRPPDAPFAYRYADLQTPAPVQPDCTTRWTSLCRITINYPQHIHGLWALPRQTLDANGVVIADNTCVRCHSPRDAMNQVRVPAGQLDLSDGPSPDNADQLNSYRELLFTDNEQVVIMGQLQDRLVTVGIDPVTNQPIQVTVPVPPSLAAGNARGSTRFFGRFATGGTHAGWLTPAELRLLSEWVDIGAQNFNNPFDPAAPLDD